MKIDNCEISDPTLMSNWFFDEELKPFCGCEFIIAKDKNCFYLPSNPAYYAGFSNATPATIMSNSYILV